MKRSKKVLICNSILLILEGIGFIFYLMRNHTLSIEYYTMDSNLLALITSLLFLIFYKTEREFIRDLRFITTCCLTVTFLVVVFVLSPMFGFNYSYFMLKEEFLFFHTICPILSIISYTCFEERSKKQYLGFAFTVLYSIVLVGLNLLQKIDGPYPFLRVREQSILMSIIWTLLIVGGSYLIGVGLNSINKKIKGAKN